MKTFFSFVNSVLLTSLILLNSFSANSQAKNDEFEAVKKQVNKIATHYADLGWFSGSVLVAKDGVVFHQASFGYSNIASKTKNTVHTKYNLGSIAKNYTAVLIMQLAEDKQLYLTDTLDKFGLGFPKNIASKITIHHLVHHRSGFADIFTAEYRQNQMSFDTIDKKLALLRESPLLFEPGTDTKYSNYGYVVLGAILEKSTGKSFETLLNENILDKIDLVNTSFLPSNTDKNQSTRYTYTHKGHLVDVGITEHAGPDGGIESTANDLQSFYRELFYGNKLLSRDKESFKDVFNNKGDHWGAYGGGLGVSAAVEVDRLSGFEIVVLANSDNLVAERISGRILAFIKDGEYLPITILPTNFAYQYYKKNGLEAFKNDFKLAYKKAEYEDFIGRPINKLGMQLVKTYSWNEAFDIFNALVSFFPEAPQVYDSLAFAYFSKGEQAKAISVFAKAISLKSNFTSDYNADNYQ